jgi:hypothetical protein
MIADAGDWGAGIHFNSKRDTELTGTEMFTVVTVTEASVSFSMVYNKLRPQQGVQAHTGAPSNGEAEEDQPKSKVCFLYKASSRLLRAI